MPGTSKTVAPNVNLDSSKILDWFGLFPGMSTANAVIKESGIAEPATPSKASAGGPAPVSDQPLLLNNPAQPAQPTKPVTLDQPLTGLEIITVCNEGQMKQEIEIELLSCNDAKFTGSLTLQEAKHGIYRDCLGFKDFKNFDGVRLAYKGVRIVAFKLKEAIEVDKLIPMQFFDYKRRVKKNNIVTEQIIKCKIKGLRSDGLKNYLERKKLENVNTGDGSTLVKISGCEYKVTEERLNEILSHWGVISSRIREEVFNDPHDSEGSNRTGIYTVRMNLHQKIPEWLPLDGLRVRVQHQGMQKLCNGCYGHHIRKDCSSDKISWHDYVGIFMQENPDIPLDFYGKWSDNLTKAPKLRSNESDFSIPTTKDELNEMMHNLKKSGFGKDDMMKIFKERKEKFEKAKNDYEQEQNSHNVN